MRVCFGVPTLCRYDLLLNLVKNVMEQVRRPEMMLIVDNGGGFSKWLFENKVAIFPCLNLQIVNPGKNLGAGGGCNLGMTLAFNAGFDAYIHSNDDLKIDPHVIKELVREAEDHPELSIIEVKDLFFTLFLVRPKWLATMGGFDEQFWPAYFEDNDMNYRMRLAKVERGLVEGLGFKHYGSATINSFSPEQRKIHDEQFRGNEQKYVAKWGGMPGMEKFQTPYNK